VGGEARIHSEERGINYSIEYVTPRNTRITTTIRSRREIERREAAYLASDGAETISARERVTSPRLASDADFLLGGARRGRGRGAGKHQRSGEP